MSCRHIERIILLILCMLLVTAPLSYAQKTKKEKLQEYYQKGIELREKGDIEGAIKAFLYVTARDHRNADAYYELGKTYIEKPTFRNLKRAEDALWQSRRISHGTKSLHALGDLYEMRTFDITSRLMFKWIVKEDTTDVRALTILADYYYRRALEDDWEKKFDINDYLLFEGDSIRHIYKEGRPSLPLSESPKYLKKGMEMIRYILDVEPDNQLALQWKVIGLLDVNNYSEFIEHYKMLLQSGTDNKTAHVMLGLGYTRINDHQNAYNHFQQALASMDSTERATFENIYYLSQEYYEPIWEKIPVKIIFKRPDGTVVGTTITYRKTKIISRFLGTVQPFKPAISQWFWEIKDPLFLTPYNERRLEHYSRIAETNLRFGKDGWKQETGYRWIRLGTPIRITTNRFAETKWKYEDFEFEFDENNIRANKIIWLKDYPDYYRFKPKGKLFDITADVVCFRGKGNNTEVNFFYDIPTDTINLINETDAVPREFSHGVFAIDRSGRRVQQNTDTLHCTIDSLFSPKNYTVSNIIEVEPDQYTFFIEAMDDKRGDTGIKRLEYDVEKFGNDELLVSGIIVARDAQIVDKNNPRRKDNITFTPNTHHLFSIGQPIHIYYEIYNLFIETEQEQNHYKTEYIIEYVPEEIGIVMKSLRKLLRITREVEKVSISNEYKGIGKTEYQLSIIKHNITRAGQYILTVRVIDLVRNVKAERTTPIGIH